jgi:uncharacterized RmlC-like cupin family protein
MAEQTTTTLNRPSTITRTPEHRAPRTERIWVASDQAVQTRLHEARTHMEAKGDKITNANLVRNARNLQYERLAKMNPDEMTTDQLTADRLALALLEVPAAAQAQHHIDTNKGPSRENSTQLAARIHFGDHLGDAAEYMPDDMIRTLPDRFFARTQNVLVGQLGFGEEDVFTRSEFDRGVIAGVAREVAVHKALRGYLPPGYDVRSSTMLENRQHVDKVVSDDTGNEIGIDVKAEGAYLKDIEKEWTAQRITNDEYEDAQHNGYLYERAMRRSEQDQLRVTINADHIGDLNLETWSYDNPEAVSELVVAQLETVRGRRLRKIGFGAINR